MMVGCSECVCSILLCGNPQLFGRTHILGGPVFGGYVTVSKTDQQRLVTYSIVASHVVGDSIVRVRFGRNNYRSSLDRLFHPRSLEPATGRFSHAPLLPCGSELCPTPSLRSSYLFPSSYTHYAACAFRQSVNSCERRKCRVHTC